MNARNVSRQRRGIAAGALAVALAMPGVALAHNDPPGCSATGVSIEIRVFRSDGVTGVVGTVSQCENIHYQAVLSKSSSGACAFSGGEFSLTLPDGTIEMISNDVPCIGGTVSPCVLGNDELVSGEFDYDVKLADVVGGFITATAHYVDGFAHDNEPDTAGVSATTPKQTPVVLCTDNNACTNDLCDPNTPGSAACSHTDIPCTDDDACTVDTCDPATGVCSSGPPKTCTDNNACTTDTCNTTTGNCEFGTPKTCNDGNACTTDTCNTTTGNCEFVDNVTPTCNDNDVCTDDSCNTQTGNCEHVPNDNPECLQAICRTPGYWGTHGAVSAQVIGLADGCLEVCGEKIKDVAVGSADSVLEAICVSPQGEQRLQLARQLTAMALNCVVSDFGADCGGNAALADLFGTCDDVCGGGTSATVGDCIGAVDCFNNGGTIDTDGLCVIDDANNCHERALPATLVLGPADTPKECTAARKNSCQVILDHEADCTAGTRSPAPETCP